MEVRVGEIESDVWVAPSPLGDCLWPLHDDCKVIPVRLGLHAQIVARAHSRHTKDGEVVFDGRLGGLLICAGPPAVTAEGRPPSS